MYILQIEAAMAAALAAAAAAATATPNTAVSQLERRPQKGWEGRQSVQSSAESRLPTTSVHSIQPL